MKISMNVNRVHCLIALTAVALGSTLNITAQPNPSGVKDENSGGDGGPSPFGPPGGGGDFFFGGPGPGMREDLKIVKQFDKDKNGWLNTQEREAARKYLEEEGNANRRRGPGGPGGPGGRRGGRGGFAENGPTPTPGAKISPTDVKSYPDASLYASNVIRTIFLEFESSNWEKELESFHGTDVEVPAKLMMDGKTYSEVGVRFRGNTSYMFTGTGRKRPFNLSMDMAHEDQNLLGFRTLNLLNGHEDPTFLRAVLALQMARDYFPAPRANFVRLVINGESWGLYANVEQFNKDFLRDRFGTTKRARWKVPGSPGGRGGLEYLGDDVAQYKSIYQIKSKDEPKAWDSLISLCKTLDETSAEELEAKLSTVLDVDSVLRFLAWDNVVAGGDGFWTRASDYCLYEDPNGRFHFFPYDVNETFSSGGGPGGPGGFGGPGGPGGFGPGMFLAPQLFETGDKNDDGKLSSKEFEGVAGAWFEQMDTEKTGSVNQEQFVAGLNEMFPPPPGGGRFGPPGEGRGRVGPGMFLGPGIFGQADENKDQKVTSAEFKRLFAKWYGDWNVNKADSLDEEMVRNGLTKILPRPDFGGPGGPGGQGGRRGPGGGPGFGGPRGGPTLDPLVSANDTSKPLLSKLLAVPEFKKRYLGYVRHMAENWLDWDKIGTVAKQYQSLIADEYKKDTKKLYRYEQFETALESTGGEGQGKSLKSFVEERRNYLLNNADVKGAVAIAPK